MPIVSGKLYPKVEKFFDEVDTEWNHKFTIKEFVDLAVKKFGGSEATIRNYAYKIANQRS